MTEIFIHDKIKVDLIINICFMEKETEKTEKKWKAKRSPDLVVWAVSEAAKLGGIDNKNNSPSH